MDYPKDLYYHQYTAVIANPSFKKCIYADDVGDVALVADETLGTVRNP